MDSVLKPLPNSNFFFCAFISSPTNSIHSGVFKLVTFVARVLSLPRKRLLSRKVNFAVGDSLPFFRFEENLYVINGV